MTLTPQNTYNPVDYMYCYDRVMGFDFKELKEFLGDSRFQLMTEKTSTLLRRDVIYCFPKNGNTRIVPVIVLPFLFKTATSKLVASNNFDEEIDNIVQILKNGESYRSTGEDNNILVTLNGLQVTMYHFK